MGFTRYTLTCDGCEEPFYSQEAFPKPHYCSSCLVVFNAGIKEVVEWLDSICGEMLEGYVYINKELWQAKLKEWNIIPPA